MQSKFWSSWVAVAIAALTLTVWGLVADSAYAQVRPGDFITPANASKVKDLVSPGVFYKV